MKKFLTIVFSVFVVLSFVGCATTKVEEPIEEEIVFTHPESYHFEVFARTGFYPNAKYKSLGIIEVPKDVPVKYETSEKCDGLEFRLQEYKYNLGLSAKSFEFEYFIYEDAEVFRYTSIYEKNFPAEMIGKELCRDIDPTIRENNKETVYYFMTDAIESRYKLTIKFYEEVVLNQ